MNRRPILVFVLATAALCAAVFRDALWGQALLAPLDVATALYSKYRVLDPASSGVPANHYVLDQMNYDLPIQQTVYESYRHGEMPWWDPYTYAGRPLLADAHINGTDPVRLLCYATLPFTLAYNWTLVLHSCLAGLGMFCLLRYWGVGGSVSALLAWAFQFSGYLALWFGHPWLGGSLLYYPWLWLAWDAWSQRRWRWSWPLATVALAGIFYAGNLQSHAYAVIFAAAWLVGTAGLSWVAWRRLLPLVALTGIGGAALAAPVLTGQVEFFLNSVRAATDAAAGRSFLAGAVSAGAVFPWAMGTFRTLDLSRLVVNTNAGLGFQLFIGAPAFVLAAIGGWCAPPTPQWRGVRSVCLALVAAYLVVMSTPLIHLFYSRTAALAVLGLVPLAAMGVATVWRSTAAWRRTGWTVLAVTGLLAIGLNVAAFLVYPRILPKVRQLIAARGDVSRNLSAPNLREFQIVNLPNEISFRNPEVVLACLSLACLAAVLLRPSLRRREFGLPLVLGMSLLPAVLFYARFVPHHPVGLWQQLRAGAPDQRRVADRLGGTAGRLDDQAPNIYDCLYPSALAHVYRVRVAHGYSALQPRSFMTLTADQWREVQQPIGDFSYTSEKSGDATGVFKTNVPSGSAVFQWTPQVPRTLAAQLISLNRFRLDLGAGPAATLVWTDTQFPGWRAWSDCGPIPIRAHPPCFSELVIPAEARWVELRYRPTWLGAGLALAGVGLAMLVAMTWLTGPRRPAAPAPA